jgi:hypothetical protein
MLLNGRLQALVQDDIVCTGAIQWRMHTNATVNVQGTSAVLEIGEKQMHVELINPPSGATFGTAQPVRYADDPPLPSGATDQPNPGVTVLTIDLPAGSYSLQVLFTPQWPGVSSSTYVTPASVQLSQWSLNNP